MTDRELFEKWVRTEWDHCKEITWDDDPDEDICWPDMTLITGETIQLTNEWAAFQAGLANVAEDEYTKAAVLCAIVLRDVLSIHDADVAARVGFSDEELEQWDTARDALSVYDAARQAAQRGEK